MKRLIILLMFISLPAYAFEINCNYDKGYQVCNGYRLTKEGLEAKREQDKNKPERQAADSITYTSPTNYEFPIDVQQILSLGYGYQWLTEQNKIKYGKLIRYLELDK